MRGMLAGAAAALAVVGRALLGDSRGSRPSGHGFAGASARGPGLAALGGDPLAGRGLLPADLWKEPTGSPVRFLGKSKYLNGARVVATHTIDDSTRDVATCLDAMDKYGIKATVFVSTKREPISQLWPRLRQAIRDGHEVGSHSRHHKCGHADTPASCVRAYSDNLNRTAYPASVTLEFVVPEGTAILAGGEPLADRPQGPTDRWDGAYVRRDGETVLVTVRSNTILEFC